MWSTASTFGGVARSNAGLASTETRLTPARRTSMVVATGPDTKSSGTTTGTSAVTVPPAGMVTRSDGTLFHPTGRVTATCAVTSALPLLVTGTASVACSTGSAPSMVAVAVPTVRPDVTVAQ